MEWWKRIQGFFQSTREELHRVTWPSRESVMEHTVMVIITITFLGTFLWLIDLIAGQLLHFIIKQLTG